MKIEPYLFFNGRCEEAINFYREAVGASVTLIMRFSESPEPQKMPLPAGWESKIMHAAFQIGGATIMASDGMTSEEAKFSGFSLSIAAADPDAAKHLFTGLSNGGAVLMPLEKTFWSPCFGMLMDRFGVRWMVSVSE
ncbi:MAG: VOC family protein [Undibacterium sp.]|uniref:VOC family protein n=1 Tax=Undibacterium sp. TaxID=1914977 RepID=UPI00271FC1DA|nr:VOC family protein [Undibacterium sp.]MDO8654802.1 VOC family protein [Undibacterium sp.]